MSEFQTWSEICKAYPCQNVGLKNVKWGRNEATVAAGEVVCSEKDTSIEEMKEMALRGQIIMYHTDLDDVLESGLLLM